jgi:hypothetical protein
LVEQRCELASHRGGIGMVGAERRFANHQRAFVERPRRGEITLRLE